MGSNEVKRPTYDGNACLLYDFMVAQGMTEELILERMGMQDEIISGRPWYPASLWIQEPISIPIAWIPRVCVVLSAPLDALRMKSFILNGKEFSLEQHMIGEDEKKRLENMGFDDVLRALKRSGFRVLKEARYG